MYSVDVHSSTLCVRLANAPRRRDDRARGEGRNAPNSASGTVIRENYGENRVETQYKKIHLELSPLSETSCSTPWSTRQEGYQDGLGASALQTRQLVI